MSPESFAILIVAEDPDLRASIQSSLLATGFVLAEVTSAKAAIEVTETRRFHLILVDVNVGGGGADACRALRARSPSVGLIAVRAGGAGESADEDEWRMLEAGADDFVAAPFRYREIVARISAVLRRPPASKIKARTVLRAGNIELDPKRRVAWRDGREIHLSPREFDLLSALMINKGAALTHTRLARSAWGNDMPRNRQYLRTYIQSLRQKLEIDPARPQHILTQPWVGYRFSDSLTK
jgi:two-component system KDP operon response regulator KdpE